LTPHFCKTTKKTKKKQITIIITIIVIIVRPSVSRIPRDLGENNRKYKIVAVTMLLWAVVPNNGIVQQKNAVLSLHKRENALERKQSPDRRPNIG